MNPTALPVLIAGDRVRIKSNPFYRHGAAKKVSPSALPYVGQVMVVDEGDPDVDGDIPVRRADWEAGSGFMISPDSVEPLVEWGEVRTLHDEDGEAGMLADPDCDEFEIVGHEPEDVVNHPSHYTMYPVEVIELTEHMNFCRGNAVKYIARAGLKSKDTEIQDLRKAIWYIEREIARLGGGDA